MENFRSLSGIVWSHLTILYFLRIATTANLRACCAYLIPDKQGTLEKLRKVHNSHPLTNAAPRSLTKRVETVFVKLVRLIEIVRIKAVRVGKTLLRVWSHHDEHPLGNDEVRSW